jgi:outer membrane biosynthesis protein TonB
MDPGFEWRLKAALDRVTPPASSPRYQLAVMGSARTWPVGPALLAAASTMFLLAVTAAAATGSPNPVVWAERAGTTIQSVGHTPETSPSPEPSENHSAPAAQPKHQPEQEPKETPEPKESPDPKERPEAPESSSHSGDQSGPRLSPTPPPS